MGLRMKGEEAISRCDLNRLAGWVRRQDLRKRSWKGEEGIRRFLSWGCSDMVVLVRRMESWRYCYGSPSGQARSQLSSSSPMSIHAQHHPQHLDHGTMAPHWRLCHPSGVCITTHTFNPIHQRIRPSTNLARHRTNPLVPLSGFSTGVGGMPLEGADRFSLPKWPRILICTHRALLMRWKELYDILSAF